MAIYDTGQRFRSPARLLKPICLLSSLLYLLLILLMGSVVFGEVGSRPFPITMEGSAPYYGPVEALLQPHTPIQWSNRTASPHTVQHDGCLLQEERCAFDSGVVPPNETYTIRGLQPGRYAYHCEMHPIMKGILIVRERQSES